MRVDLTVETALDHTPRVKQLSGMFDVPAREKLSHHWVGDVPLDDRPWNVGLIVGPSGAGKTSVARALFGAPATVRWKAKAVVDDFDPNTSIQDVAAMCSAVGFNTIPSWMKPYRVLSTGEQFRVTMARHLLEGGDLVCIDEFTSVVDRQVAKIGSNAVQKLVRKRGSKFVAVTCHYDVIDWLQPDWVLEPATMTFNWREVQRRPEINVEIQRVSRASWELFAPFHYLTAELARHAACFVLFVDGVPAAFAGSLHRPHPKSDDIKGLSRVVTLPDYQGLGLAFVLMETLGAAYTALHYRLHIYPAHPSFIRSADRSDKWSMIKKPFYAGTPNLKTSSIANANLDRKGRKWMMGSRPCAAFEYVGDAMDAHDARRLLEGECNGSSTDEKQPVLPGKRHAAPDAGRNGLHAGPRKGGKSRDAHWREKGRQEGW